MTSLTRLGKKTPSKSLHERRNLHELAEGDCMAAPHPDHLTFSGGCGVPGPFVVSFILVQSHRTVELTRRYVLPTELLKPSTTPSCFCKLVPFWRSIICSVRATTTLDAPRVPVSDHMSFPYTSACASQLQKYMCDKHSSEVYSWSMALHYDVLVTLHPCHAGTLGLHILGVVSRVERNPPDSPVNK
jgi:hypothetical protein